MFRATGCGPTSYELEKYMKIMDGEPATCSPRRAHLPIKSDLPAPRRLRRVPLVAGLRTATPALDSPPALAHHRTTPADENSGFITEQPFLDLMQTLRHPKEPSARLRAVYDVLAKGRQKKKKKKFNPFEAMSAKEEDLSFMAEKDWAKLVERLRITHLFDNWQREGDAEDGELNEGTLGSRSRSRRSSNRPTALARTARSSRPARHAPTTRRPLRQHAAHHAPHHPATTRRVADTDPQHAERVRRGRRSETGDAVPRVPDDDALLSRVRRIHACAGRLRRASCMEHGMERGRADGRVPAGAGCAGLCVHIARRR